MTWQNGFCPVDKREDISYKMSNIENYEVLEKHDVQLNFRRRKMVAVFIGKEAVLKFDENLIKHAIDVIEIDVLSIQTQIFLMYANVLFWFFVINVL